jgi:hypothetical protein
MADGNLGYQDLSSSRFTGGLTAFLTLTHALQRPD